MKYCISIDWFQLFGKSTEKTQLILGTYIAGDCNCPAGYRPAYYVIASREKHPIFRDSYCVTLRGFPLIHIFAHPKMSVMKADAVAVKVANRALYTSTWAWYLNDILRLTGIVPISVTRVDLCCDLQTFSGGLEPTTFIQRYLNDGEAGVGVQYTRVGSNKYCVHGDKRMFSGQRPNYWLRRIEKDIDPDEGAISKEDSPNFSYSTWSQHQYLRFGTRKSGVSVYLYNKSLELLEKHSKPYISEMWQQNGIIEDDTKPVYRLEFSINAKGMSVENKPAQSIARKLGVKDLRSLTIEDFSTQARLEDIFWGYCNKFWRFKEVTPVKYKKDMPVVQLFDVQVESTIYPRDISKSLDTGRAERNAGKCLVRIADDYPCMEDTQRSVLREAGEILHRIGVMKQAIFDFDIPPELWFYAPDNDKWLALKKNYVARQSQWTKVSRLARQMAHDDLRRYIIRESMLR